MGLDSILRKNRTRNLGSFLKKQKSEVEQQVKVEVVMVRIVFCIDDNCHDDEDFFGNDDDLGGDD